MLPKWHVIIGGLISIILYFLLPLSLLQTFILFLSTVLIDLDHYFRYIIITKNLNPLKFWRWSMKNTEKWLKLTIEEKKDYKIPIFIFHGIEFWGLLVILSQFYPIIFLVLIGALVHMVLDFIEIFWRKEVFYFKLSQIFLYITNKKRNKRLHLS